MNKQLDVLFVSPGASEIIYQGLSEKFSAIEPPTWALLLAQSCRSKGFGVAILDCDAERLNYKDSVKRIKEINPRLVVFVVYGSNPNSGTTKMTGVIGTACALKEDSNIPVCVVGSHASALPKKVLAFKCIDFVCIGEGVYALHNLLKSDLKTDLQNIKGIGWKNDGVITLNESQHVVPQNMMDIDMPGYAWDLLPFKNKPFDLYRSCNWHAKFDESKRNPYASLYSSLGCQFKCDFCMINIINRVDYSDNVSAANSNKMRFWSPELIFKEFEKLHKLGVTTVRISDEMFLLNARFYEPLCRMLKESGIGKDLLSWAYSRIDTVRDKFLDLVRDSGIHWLALGIESGNQKVRKEVTKGSFVETDIREVCKQISNHGINIISNYIFGLTEDNFETMNQTLDLALELNTEMANMYPAFALPGSPLYLRAKNEGYQLPKTFDAWSFHSYECLPLPTQYLTAAEVLQFRDKAWSMYFKRPEYLSMIESKFGIGARQHIEEMSSIKLKRRLLGD